MATVRDYLAGLSEAKRAELLNWVTVAELATVLVARWCAVRGPETTTVAQLRAQSEHGMAALRMVLALLPEDNAEGEPARPGEDASDGPKA